MMPCALAAVATLPTGSLPSIDLMTRIEKTPSRSFTPLICLHLRNLLFFALASTAVGARATTYFVSVSGDDSNEGTSTDTPWKTLNKVSATAFKPGDRIFFKRGDTWTASNGGEQLTVSSSGASDQERIVYGTYGEGTKPIFDGFRLSGRGASASGKRYVTLQDLDFRRSSQQGVDLQSCSHVSVLRVDVTSNGKGPAINARRGGFILIDGCVVTDAKSNGIHFGGSATERIHDSTIQNCTVNGTRANDGIVIHADSSAEQNPAGTNFLIRHNTATGCAEQGFDITTGKNVSLEHNRSHGNRAGAITIGHQASDVVLRYHQSENEPAGNTAATLNISTQNVTVEYSTFTGSIHAKPIVNIKKHDLRKYSRDFLPENIVLQNNVFVWKSPTAGDIFRISSENGAVEAHHLVVRNNIFCSTTGARIMMHFMNPHRPPNYARDAMEGYSFNNNVYFSPGGVRWRVGSDTERTFARYRADFPPSDSLESVEADPLFVDAAAGNYRLKTMSPARDRGHTSPGMLKADSDGARIPMGSARDIGAFEISVDER
ncbi:MAG: right-handed parallel beta-helix repeat-containing protein [Opitutaceae bacterium]|nr:right-handed parallel beta-helix repeat-containing protein [Opitutaceae bacterium]